MQLKNLVKPLSQMTDEELLQKLRDVRHSRETVRPAARKRVEKAEKKESTKRTTKLQALLEGMSDEEKATLLKQLEEPGDAQPQ